MSAVYLPELDPRNQPQHYVRVTYDGTICVCEPWEVDSMVYGDDRSGYTFEDVWMTQAQFEQLPEFSGW